RFDDMPLAQAIHPETDEQRDRDRASDGESAPGGAGYGLDESLIENAKFSIGRLVPIECTILPWSKREFLGSQGKWLILVVADLTPFGQSEWTKGMPHRNAVDPFWHQNFHLGQQLYFLAGREDFGAVQSKGDYLA